MKIQHYHHRHQQQRAVSLRLKFLSVEQKKPLSSQEDQYSSFPNLVAVVHRQIHDCHYSLSVPLAQGFGP